MWSLNLRYLLEYYVRISYARNAESFFLDSLNHQKRKCLQRELEARGSTLIKYIGIKIRLNHLPPNSLNKDFCSSSIFLVSFGYNLSVESNLISSIWIFSSLATLTKVVMKAQQLLVPDQLWWPSLEYTKATFFQPYLQSTYRENY